MGGVELSHRFKGFWANSLKYNWPAYVIILFVFALGLTTGSLEVYKLQAGELQELSIYLDRFMDQAALIETEPAAAVKSVLYNDLILIAAIYFLGLTIIGIGYPDLDFYRGFVLGFSIVFGVAKTSRVILSCAAILPQNIIFLPALLLGGVASCLCLAPGQTFSTPGL